MKKNRFELTYERGKPNFWDNTVEDMADSYLTYEDVCDLLNEQEKQIMGLKFELDTHKHPLWSTRQAEEKVKELVDLLEKEILKNTELMSTINELRIENMRLKEIKKYGG